MSRVVASADVLFTHSNGIKVGVKALAERPFPRPGVSCVVSAVKRQGQGRSPPQGRRRLHCTSALD